MRVPLTVLDFIERAELVYGDRIGVVDEPDQPAESLGELTWAEVARLARAQAAGLDALGVGARRARRDRLAQLGPAAHVVLRRVRRTGACSCRSTSGSTPRRSRTSSSTRARRCCSSTPSSRTRSRACGARHRFVIGKAADDALLRFDTAPEPWIADEDATGTINYTSGTTARPKGVQLTHRTLWVNATTFGWQTGVSDRDVYLWTLPMFHCNGWGMSYAVTGMGGAPHRAAQGRRRGDPAPRRTRTA